MPAYHEQRPNERGFTLVELLIAIFLSTMVLAAGYTVFKSSSRAATHQNLDNRMQDNARMAMDVLARDFRRAGFLVNFMSYPGGTTIQGAGSKLVTQNATTAADRVTVVGGDLIPVGTLVQSISQGASSLVLTSAGTITAGDVIGIGYTFSGRVQAVAGTTVTLDTSVPTGVTNMAYPGEFSGGVPTSQTPASVRRLTTTLYWIDVAANPLHPVLMQGGQPVAEDIEDLQIAYGLDQNNDRIIQAGEWVNNRDLTTAEIEKVRLARITIVARSANPDPALVGRAQTVPGIEDRPARNNITDGYRRYTLTRIVKTKNIEALFTL